jgi:hypothetical protein
MKYLSAIVLMLIGSLNIAQAQQVEGVSLEEMPLVELPGRLGRQPGEFGELQYWLNKKDPAPFAGVIVNPEGWSYVLTEYQALELRARAALETQRKQDHAYVNLRVGELQIEVNNLKEINDIKLAAREADLVRCQEINKIILKDQKKQARRGKILYGVGGVVVGTLLGIFLQAFVF